MSQITRRQIIRQIIERVLEAATLAESIGIKNLVQPGLVKEMIIAEILGHQLISSKRDADAHAFGNPSEKYEYLCCKEGGSFQFDRMFKEPEEKREKSLNRITRNIKIYFAIFYASNQLKCKMIYELNPQDILEDAERQLDTSKNVISHLGFSIPWIDNRGIIVYPRRGRVVR